MSHDELLDVLESRFLSLLSRLVSKSFEGLSSKQAVDFVIRQVTRLEEGRGAKSKKGDDEENEGNDEKAKEKEDESDAESVASDDVRDDEQAGSLAKAKPLVSSGGNLDVSDSYGRVAMRFSHV